MSNKEHQILKNYNDFINRIDIHAQKVRDFYTEHIACRKGCDSCCRKLSLFPVEAFAVSKAFETLDISRGKRVLTNLEKNKDICPLLIDHECYLYNARPLICRTHGYPVVIEEEGQIKVDFCPENFPGIKDFANEMLLNLNQINIVLSAVNSHFLAGMGEDPQSPDRISISKAIFL
jgi:uncharacterized protein